MNGEKQIRELQNILKDVNSEKDVADWLVYNWRNHKVMFEMKLLVNQLEKASRSYNKSK